MNGTWTKSSYSTGQTNCVEVRQAEGKKTMKDTWAKSSYCANEPSCVETRRIEGAVGVRDSKDTARQHLSFETMAWQAFIAGVRGRR